MFGDRLKIDSMIRYYRLLFIAWLITLPFGAKLFPLSLGVLTIYPNLILTLCCATVIVFTWRQFSRTTYALLALLFGWLMVFFTFTIVSGLDAYNLFDIRSLGMQALTACVLIGMAHALTDFWDLMKRGIRLYLFLITTAGVVEFLTGIHFSGSTTAMFADLPVGNIFYTPLFIYDNPNDYLLYGLFFGALLSAIDTRFRSSMALQSIFIVVFFAFATYADSRFAKLILIIWTVKLLVPVCINYRLDLFKRFRWYGLGVVLLGVVAFLQPLFLGPKYGDGKGYRLNAIQQLDTIKGQVVVQPLKTQLNKAEQRQLILALDSANTNNPSAATNLRKNLIYIGVEMARKAPVLGVGPGGFRRELSKQKDRYFVGEHQTPHNAVIELVAQYGVFGWLYVVTVVFYALAFMRIAIKQRSTEAGTWVFFCALIPIFWMMPSAYLYLDLHWILLPILHLGYQTRTSVKQV